MKIKDLVSEHNEKYEKLYDMITSGFDSFDKDTVMDYLNYLNKEVEIKGD